MKTINFVLSAALLATVAAGVPLEAHAAACDTAKSKFTWRRCMSKEIDKLSDAIGQKALDQCSSKSNSASGPAAVDERLTCRVEVLRKTLQAM